MSGNNILHSAEAQEAISPHSHVYKIKRSFDKDGDRLREKPLKIMAFGCAGSGDHNQKAVALAMKKRLAVLKEAGNLPDMIVINGDNVYDSGLTGSPQDQQKQLADYFYSIYSDIFTIYKIPFFLGLGNHGYNYHRVAMGEQGPQVAHRQVAHTREQEPSAYKKDKTRKELDLLYASDELDVKDLPAWNMPHRYYKLECGNQHLFFIDSNTYVKDYIAHVSQDPGGKGEEQEEAPEENQAAWLEAQYKISHDAGKKIIFVQHHPLFPKGKRAKENFDDIGVYGITEEELAKLPREMMPHRNQKSHQVILRAIYEKQGFLSNDSPRAVVADAAEAGGIAAVGGAAEVEDLNSRLTLFVAHRHANGFTENARADEFTVGAGGGKLQSELLNIIDMRLCQIFDFGFSEYTVSPESESIEFFTCHNGSVVFNKSNNDKEFQACYQEQEIPAERKEDDNDNEVGYWVRVKGLRETVQKACQDYLTFALEHQGRFGSHGQAGVDRAVKLWHYALQYQSLDTDTIKVHLEEVFSEHMKVSTKTHSNVSPYVFFKPGLHENSLFQYIGKALVNNDECNFNQHGFSRDASRVRDASVNTFVFLFGLERIVSLGMEVKSKAKWERAWAVSKLVVYALFFFPLSFSARLFVNVCRLFNESIGKLSDYLAESIRCEVENASKSSFQYGGIPLMLKAGLFVISRLVFTLVSQVLSPFQSAIHYREKYQGKHENVAYYSSLLLSVLLIATASCLLFPYVSPLMILCSPFYWLSHVPAIAVALNTVLSPMASGLKIAGHFIATYFAKFMHCCHASVLLPGDTAAHFAEKVLRETDADDYDLSILAPTVMFFDKALPGQSSKKSQAHRADDDGPSYAPVLDQAGAAP